MPDLIGEPLTSAADLLSARHIEYDITVTRPARRSFELCDDCLYVVRQSQDVNGKYHLVVAAKMEKEV